MEPGSRSAGGPDGPARPDAGPDGGAPPEPAAAAPLASRALLTPGPLAPLSHLGVTLLRHAVATGLRYALFQLGLPLPEAPPVRIVRLRLYLDAGKLADVLARAPGGVPGGSAVAAALIDPGGRGALPRSAGGLAAALAFHRGRLRLMPRRLPGRLARATVTAGDSPAAILAAFESGLRRVLPAIGDALLADLAAALKRRSRRSRGEAAPPAITPAARRVLAGRGSPGGRAGDLARLGAPDLRQPSWGERPELAMAARRALDGWPMPPVDPRRGRFRETWRAALTLLSPLFGALAASAATRGLLNAPDDAFFIPFDLVGDLAGERRPAWMEAAVAANRAEHEALRQAAEPLDLLTARQETTPDAGERAEWELAPLLPLP